MRENYQQADGTIIVPEVLRVLSFLLNEIYLKVECLFLCFLGDSKY